MVDLPVSTRSNRYPVVPALQRRADRPNPNREQDAALAMSMFTNISPDKLQLNLEAGIQTDVMDVRRDVNSQSPDLQGVVLEAQAQGIPAEEALDRIHNHQSKLEEWHKASDGIYLEQAIALNDPSVDAELSRFATNMQIAQDLLTLEMDRVAEDNSWVGMTAGWIDRELIRGVAIGSFEQITNRNERKGHELVGAVSTMSTAEFTEFFSAYVEELGGEGFFDRDNYHAYAQGMYELQTAGHDPDEAFNRIFGGLLSLPGLGLVGKSGKALTAARATSPLTRVAALRGVAAADDAAEALIRNTEGAPHPSVIVDTGPSAMAPGRSGPRPSINRAIDNAENNVALRGLKENVDKDFLGQGVTSTAVREAASKLSSGLAKITNRPIADIRPPVRTDTTGGFVLDVDIGTLKTGAPFTARGKGQAERMARTLQEDFPTAKVRPVDPNDTSKGYYVNVTQRLDIGDSAAELSTKSTLGPINKIMARLMGSKATIEDDLLNDLAVNAEGGMSTIGKLIRPQVKLLTGLSVKSKDSLSRIFSDLRDGPDAYRTASYSNEEFTVKWKDLTGSNPTQRDIDAFRALQDINDTSWFMRAHNRLQKYVERGYYAIKDMDGNRLAGKAVDDVADGELVTDLSVMRTVRKGDLPKNTKVWKLDRELEGGNVYATRPSEVSILSHEDVLGYNAGGRRVNPEANYFVTLGKDTPRAFLSTFTESQARQAVDFFRGYQKLVRAGADDTVLDDFIGANNDWNPGVTNKADLDQFAKDKRIDLTDDINFKVRDDEIQTGEVLDDFSNTWGEYVTFGMHRSDDVITEYGGREARQRDPVSAIFDDYSTTADQFAHNAVTQQGIHGWVKAAERQGSGWDVPPGSDARKRFMAATNKNTNSSSALELGVQRSILETRMKVKSSAQKAMEEYGAGARDYIFDNTKGKVRTSNDFGLPAAANKMLSLAFQSAFGFFNMSQLLVQGFHAPVIAAMAPKYGMKGLAMSIPLRTALMTDDIAVERLAVQRIAKYTGMTPEDVSELLDFIHTSGRMEINESTVMNGTPTQWGLSGWKGESTMPTALREARQVGSRAIRGSLDTGTIAFKEGDRWARLTGIATAFLEFKAKNPTASALEQGARRAIRRREEALTLRMTNANRATIQEGALKLPTQWWSHSLRTLENVFIGRDLTKGERTRLLGMYTVAFGTTGMGVGWAGDYMAEKIGAEASGTIHTAMKYGFIDALTHGVSDGNIHLALAERMAPITLFQGVYNDIYVGDKTPLEAALGPSFDITTNFKDGILAASADILHGNYRSSLNDVSKTMRNFTGIDNVAKAMGMIRYGTYRSRSGKTVPGEYSSGDAVAQALGFTPGEVREWYSNVKQFEYRNSVKTRDFTNMMKADMVVANDAFRDGDDERGFAIMREIGIRIEASNLSEVDKQEVRRGLEGSLDNLANDSIAYRLIRDREFDAQVIHNNYIGDN